MCVIWFERWTTTKKVHAHTNHPAKKNRKDVHIVRIWFCHLNPIHLFFTLLVVNIVVIFSSFSIKNEIIAQENGNIVMCNSMEGRGSKKKWKDLTQKDNNNCIPYAHTKGRTVKGSMSPSIIFFLISWAALLFIVFNNHERVLYLYRYSALFLVEDTDSSPLISMFWNKKDGKMTYTRCAVNKEKTTTV